ncbi:hypothetical protein NQ315_012902 [Exocentrus adspersus]|uniref:CCHC-type domain-containing protein n=1 Tax=Exocentrus adspersus TaxID=1586481 RepID=A0AAV8VSH2_9CUCU|nr:hypothetical protein NQ315_012902 [Exocentrus adspersus]
MDRSRLRSTSSSTTSSDSDSRSHRNRRRDRSESRTRSTYVTNTTCKGRRRDRSDSRTRPTNVTDTTRRCRHGRDRSESRTRFTNETDTQTRSNAHSFTPPSAPSRGNLQRLELLVERLIEHGVSSRTDSSRSNPSNNFVKPECIPEFKPGNPNLSCAKWISKIEQLGRIHHWEETTKIYHMQTRLSGLARNWYANLRSYELTWEEWKNLLLKSFPEHQDFATSLRKMLNRRKLPKESWEEYYFNKMDLIQVCDVSAKNAVSCIIDGIDDRTIQVGARAGRYETPDALYAEYLSSLSQQENVIRKATYPENAESSRKRFYSDERRDNFGGFMKRRKIGTKHEQKCYNCRQTGHMANSCPKPRLECTNCKRLGHLGKDCRRRLKSQVVSFNSSQQQDNEKYFFDCFVNGRQLKAYVDTGCGAILIREEQAKELKLKTEPSSVTITGYGASVVAVVGQTEFTIVIDRAKANVKAFVVPNMAQEVDVMIGQPFLHSPDVVMIVANGKVRIFSSHDDLGEVLHSTKGKIPLWAKTAVTVPSRTTALVAVTSRSSATGEVYIRGGLRAKPGQEHYIGECVTEADGGYVSVTNISPHDVQMLFCTTYGGVGENGRT